MAADETYIVKRRDPLSDVILSENKEALAQFFDQPFPAIVEAITGALAAGPTAWMPMTGRIVQGALKGKVFQQVSREIKGLRERDKIDDFAERELGYLSWVELMQIIDEETPEGEKLEALKAMFYGVNKVNTADGERIIAYQLLQTAKRLTSGELFLLKAVFEMYKANDFDPNAGRITELDEWAAKVTNRMGHALRALTLRDERRLVEEGLISPRFISPTHRRAGVDQEVVFEANARLTDLGIKFCSAIQTYQLDTKPKE